MTPLFVALLLAIPVDHNSGMRCHPDQWVAKTGDWLVMKCQNSLGEYTYWKKVYNDFELQELHKMHTQDCDAVVLNGTCVTCGFVPTPTVILTPTVIDPEEAKNEPK